MWKKDTPLEVGDSQAGGLSSELVDPTLIQLLNIESFCGFGLK